MNLFINFFLLLTQIALLCSLILLTLKLGKEAMYSFLPLLAICMNLFVVKQITLFGLHITCSEGLAVGYLLGFNLMQEFFGKEAAKKSIVLTFFSSSAFILLSQLHLFFIPSTFDSSQVHFAALFPFLPRLLIASLISFLLTQLFDLTFFNYLKRKWKNKYLTSRISLSLILSQAIDTLLFSFLALYGVVEALFHVMLFSFLIKVSVIFFSTPFIRFAKRISGREQISV